MNYESISAKDIDSYIRKPNILIVDIRNKDVYEKNHIQGAIHFDFKELEKNYSRLPIYKTLLLYCERGGVSTRAAHFLSDKGYHVINVIGGFHSYRGINITSYYK